MPRLSHDHIVGGPGVVTIARSSLSAVSIMNVCRSEGCAWITLVWLTSPGCPPLQTCDCPPLQTLGRQSQPQSLYRAAARDRTPERGDLIIVWISQASYIIILCIIISIITFICIVIIIIVSCGPRKHKFGCYHCCQ